MYTLHEDAAIGVILLTPTYTIVYYGNIALRSLAPSQEHK